MMLSQLGTQAVRVPRRMNPYLAARKLARAARAEHPDLLFVRDVMAKRNAPEPAPSLPVPDVDTPEPDPEGGGPAPAFADAVATA
jgi:hypothetical protein